MGRYLFEHLPRFLREATLVTLLPTHKNLKKRKNKKEKIKTKRQEKKQNPYVLQLMTVPPARQCVREFKKKKIQTPKNSKIKGHIY